MRFPSTFFEASFSLRRLRTTPVRKPRTECCRQPVAFIIAAIVAPVGDCSIAMTCDCFVPGSAFGGFAAPLVNGTRAVAAPGDADGAAARFFADFDIAILRSVRGDKRRTTEAPRRPNGAGGRRSNFEKERLRICRA